MLYLVTALLVWMGCEMQFVALIELDYAAPASMLSFFCTEAPWSRPTRPTTSKPRDWILLLRLQDGHVGMYRWSTPTAQTTSNATQKNEKSVDTSRQQGQNAAGCGVSPCPRTFTLRAQNLPTSKRPACPRRSGPLFLLLSLAMCTFN
jgi:hypothetical protein